MAIILSIVFIAAGYWSFKHMSLLDMEQAAMLPFADDPEAANGLSKKPGAPVCLST